MKTSSEELSKWTQHCIGGEKPSKTKTGLIIYESPFQTPKNAFAPYNSESLNPGEWYGKRAEKWGGQVALILESGEPFEVAHHVPWTIIGERVFTVDDFLLGETGFGKWCLLMISFGRNDSS